MATQMPPVAQFSLPTPGQQQAPQQAPAQTAQGMPAVAQFSLPQSTTPSPDTSNLFNGPGSVAISPLKHFAEGDTQSVLQQSAGALGSLKGQNPFVENMIGNAPQMKQIEDNSNAQPETAARRQGEGQTAGLGFMSVGGPIGAASRVDDAMQVARQIASPKATLGSTQKLLTSFGSDPAVDRGAQAISQLVKNKVLSVGTDAKSTLKNTEALKSEIQSAGEGLVARLKGMHVQPILQPEELDKVFEDSMSQIEKNPYLDDAAKTSAQKMFSLFKSNLPQGKDIVASDILDARKAFDGTIKSMKPSAFDPKTENATSLALRAIRQNVNSLLAEKAPDAGVKESLSHQSALYDVLENVAAKGAGAVKKAEELANIPGLKGTIARHPVISGAIGTVGTSALGALGLGSVGRLLGYHLSQD